MTLTKPKSPRTSANHRKRTGQHHHRNDHYIKAYWPYLPIFAVLALGIFFNSWITRQHHSVLGYATSISAQVLLEETNDSRVSAHEDALQLNDQLTAAAQAKANDMANRDYWSHVTPDGKQPWSFIDTTGYQYEAAGENLAYGFGTSDQVMTAWINSPDHKANIMDPDYQDVGFATAQSPNYQGTGPETIVVAMYGEPIGMINASTNSTVSKPVVLGTRTESVSRLQLLSKTSSVQIVVAAICGAALMWFIIRHTFAWHKVLVKGERFFIHHPYFDVFLMSALVIGFVLFHTAGSIL
ncbi:MAG: CAP domain-containing protein [Candidatus Saccharibacteria bacterium]